MTTDNESTGLIAEEFDDIGVFEGPAPVKDSEAETEGEPGKPTLQERWVATQILGVGPWMVWGVLSAFAARYAWWHLPAAVLGSALLGVCVARLRPLRRGPTSGWMIGGVR